MDRLATESHSTFEVVLVSMPFAPLRMPSLGLSLLKPALAAISTKVFYFGFPFAGRIGIELYDAISFRELRESAQAGEWVFGGALFESPPRMVQEYLTSILGNESRASEILAARAGAADFIDWCAGRVLECKPKIVGFTSVFQQNVASLALAGRIKQRDTEVFVLFGGANSEGVMGAEMVRQFAFVDASVSGEADSVFPEIVGRVIRREPVEGLPGVATRKSLVFGNPVSRSPSIRDLDSLPYPDFDDFFEQFNSSNCVGAMTPRLQFETSRGCWWGQLHHCTFCGLNGATMAFRAKSEARALAELLSLVERYPGYPVMVTDNILDMNYFRNFIPEIAHRKLKVRLFYEIKANLKKEQVRLLREAGILQVQPGIESFSDQVLSLMRKGIRGLQNIQLLKWCKEMGIWPNWNLLWGFPGECAGEYARMASLIPLLAHLPPPAAARPIRMDRYSPNFELSKELGFSNVRPAAAYSYLYPVKRPALDNLAYYFDYDYSEPRDVDSYTRPVVAAVDNWRAVHGQSEFVYEDNGRELLIWDLRPDAIHTYIKLKGSKRKLYLACDSVRGIRWIVQNTKTILGRSMAPSKVNEMLNSMIGLGLMTRDNDSVLSLAVRADAGVRVS
jgi:ribosomal peptide maturation radical SAM protein 1